MIEYKYDEESVNALVAWVKEATFPTVIKISEAESITNVKQFIKSNLSDIEQHYPDPFYNPAITRLYWLKFFLKAD